MAERPKAAKPAREVEGLYCFTSPSAEASRRDIENLIIADEMVNSSVFLYMRFLTSKDLIDTQHEQPTQRWTISLSREHGLT